MRGAVERPYGSDKAGAGLFDDQDSATGLRLGQRVLHQKFGEGVVLQSEGNGDRARVQINFASAGSKWLMVGYANLEALE
jgi:DNA helicase-2/ATP-dependent DNA helicase PcrA